MRALIDRLCCALQDLLWNIALMLVMAAVWVVGSNVMRKYMQQGVVANPIAGAASSVQPPGANSYSPKEYNKENMPEQVPHHFSVTEKRDFLSEQVF